MIFHNLPVVGSHNLQWGTKCELDLSNTLTGYLIKYPLEGVDFEIYGKQNVLLNFKVPGLRSQGNRIFVVCV